jgi:hypothetical protein
MKKILIGCEESQTTCKAFRKLGFDAYSCDIQDQSGGHPEWHIQDDIFYVINQNDWDLLIGHPPCTYLSHAGNGYFNYNKYGNKAIDRYINRNDAVQFFLKLYTCNIKHICLENPIGFINSFFKPTQIIQPYYFGDKDQKTTCLWLKNLPLLEWSNKKTLFFDKTSVDKPDPIFIEKSGKKRYFTDSQSHKDPIIRSKLRSKSFPAIANAMANQWGNFLNNK